MLDELWQLRAWLDTAIPIVERAGQLVATFLAAQEACQAPSEAAKAPTPANRAAAPGAPKRRRGRPRETVRVAADKVFAALDAIGRRCHECGAPLPDNAAGRRIYCSASCRTLSYRRRRDAGIATLSLHQPEPDPDLALLPDNPERPFNTEAVPDDPDRAALLKPPKLSWEASA